MYKLRLIITGGALAVAIGGCGAEASFENQAGYGLGAGGESRDLLALHLQADASGQAISVPLFYPGSEPLHTYEEPFRLSVGGGNHPDLIWVAIARNAGPDGSQIGLSAYRDRTYGTWKKQVRLNLESGVLEIQGHAYAAGGAYQHQLTPPQDRAQCDEYLDALIFMAGIVREVAQGSDSPYRPAPPRPELLFALRYLASVVEAVDERQACGDGTVTIGDLGPILACREGQGMGSSWDCTDVTGGVHRCIKITCHRQDRCPYIFENVCYR